MAETRYYAEYLLTGNTSLKIEDVIYLEKGSGLILSGTYPYLGVGKVPNTQLDVRGQIRLTSGSTNLEGEIRYKNQSLWVNTGGTSADWVSLTTSNQFSGATDPDFWYDSPNDTLYDPKIKLTSTTGWTEHAANYWGLFIDRSDGLVYANSGSSIGNGTANDLLWWNTGSKTWEPTTNLQWWESDGYLFLDAKTSLMRINNFDNAVADGPRIYLSRGSGSTTANAAIINNAVLGEIIFQGTIDSTGSRYGGASIDATSTENWGGSNRRAKFTIKTNNSSAALINRIEIDGSGHTNIENGTLFTQSFSPILKKITSNTKLDDTYFTVIVSGATTATLQKASNWPYRTYTIKRHGTSGVQVVCDDAGDRIVLSSALSVTGLTLTTDGYAITVHSDGINKWYVTSFSDRVTG